MDSLFQNRAQCTTAVFVINNVVSYVRAIIFAEFTLVQSFCVPRCVRRIVPPLVNTHVGAVHRAAELSATQEMIQSVKMYTLLIFMP